MNILSSATPIIWCDNLNTVHLIANLVLHARTKHIEINLYFVHEKVLQKKIRIHHILSSFNLLIYSPKLFPFLSFSPYETISVLQPIPIEFEGWLLEMHHQLHSNRQKCKRHRCTTSKFFTQLLYLLA